VGRIDRLVLRIVIVIGFLAIAALALIYANDWWLSGIMTASILCWLSGLLAAIYSRPEQRPVRVGALVFSLLYVALALGPWFRGQVGPWLVTSQALTHVETKWLGRQPPQPVQQQIVTSYPVLMDSGFAAINTGYVTSGSTAVWTVAQPPSAPPASRFVDTGHWLCGWLAAVIGGIAAGWIARRRPSQPKEPAEPAP
jgi:hypothetical protein